jgi:hypothetical protein
MTRLACLSVFVSLLALNLGCSAKVTHIEVDPGFTPERIEGEGLAVLGVTSAAGDGSEAFELSRLLTSSLHGELRSRRGDIRCVPWGDVRLAAGDSLLNACLAEIYEYERIRPASLDSLANRVRSNARYALVQRIESDRLEFSESDKSENIDGEWKVTGTELKTTRTITSTFTIYDLDSSSRVWLATIEGKRETTRDVRPEDNVDFGGWLGKVVDVVEAVDNVLGEPEAPESFPDPATRESVMESVYKKFIEELPTREG